MGTFLSILFLFCLIFGSGFTSSSETALFSLSSMKQRVFRQDPSPRKQMVASLLAYPRDLLVTILMINVIMNILVQNVVSHLFGDVATWALKVGVPLTLTLIFGEVLPKTIALANNETIALFTAPVIFFSKRILYPFRKVLTIVTSAVSRGLFFFLKKEEEISLDELEHALKASLHQGVLREEEADLVGGFLQLKEKPIKEVMRPRDEIIVFNIEEPLSRLVYLFVDQECSRVPICQGDLNNVIGVMTSRIYFLKQDKLKDSSDIHAIMKQPFFVPESMTSEMLLHQFYEKKENMAVVVDEFGTVSGLITLEDLVEEVIGEISDKRDTKELYTRQSDDVIIASGKLELSEFEEIFGIDLPCDRGVVTLGGWLTEKMGDIPQIGSHFKTEDFFFHVLNAEPNRVTRIFIRKLKKGKS